MAAATLALAAVLVWGVADGRISASLGGAAGAAGAGGGGRAASGGPVEGGVLALSQDRREIVVLHPDDGSVRGRISLEAEAAGITPTPGGVSVFVTYAERPVITVHSTTDYELQERIELGAGVPEDLTFSENGSTLFVTYRESDTVSVFSHSMRKLSEPYHFEVPGGRGAVVRNRRATRLYRQTGDGLAVIYAQNGAVIEEIDVEARHWRFNSGFTHLWGIGADGRARMVAERSGRITVLPQRLRAEAGAGAIAVTGSERRVLLLREGGREALAVDGRSGKELFSVALPFAAERLTVNGAGAVWAVGADGRIAVIDTRAEAVTASYRTAPAGVSELALSIVQQEGNFACF